MICPKCNSEKVQYATKTTGSNYGMIDGCCGFLLMGPLGLLCGLCGNDVETKEFWICQNCGHKFSNDAAIKTLQNAKAVAATCEQYKAELGSHPTSYYKTQYENAKNVLRYAEQAYDQQFDALVEKHAPYNALVGKYKKKYCKEKRPGCIFWCVLAILGILLCLVGLFPVGIVIAGIAFVFGLISLFKEKNMHKKVENFFVQADASFKACQERKAKAESEKEYWERYADKATYIENHDKQ